MEEEAPVETTGQSTNLQEALPSSVASEKAPVKAPAGFNNDYCYGVLSEADRQVAASRDMTEKNRRNISRLAKSTVNQNARMKAQERRGVKE